MAGGETLMIHLCIQVQIEDSPKSSETEQGLQRTALPRRAAGSQPSPRPTRQRAAHRPYAPRKASYDLSRPQAENQRPPPTRCARPPAPRRISAASSPPREGPCWRAPRTSQRAAKDKPGTQVGLLEQTFTADQVSRCTAEQPPVLRIGKREARDASRRAPARAGHGQGRAFRAVGAVFGRFGP